MSGVMMMNSNVHDFSEALRIINKANGMANRKRKNKFGDSKNDTEGIFIDGLDYINNEWVVRVTHQYSDAEKSFNYRVIRDCEILSYQMLNDWISENRKEMI